MFNFAKKNIIWKKKNWAIFSKLSQINAKSYLGMLAMVLPFQKIEKTKTKHTMDILQNGGPNKNYIVL
jgi:hypothetical protein